MCDFSTLFEISMRLPGREAAAYRGAKSVLSLINNPVRDTLFVGYDYAFPLWIFSECADDEESAEERQDIESHSGSLDGRRC